MISVIIPAYNASRFIEKSVTSAISIPEVSEVLVINDGSTDHTDEILKKIADSSNKLKVLYHPGHTNRGAAESRNIGIINATCEFIAFLDADDFYLSNRFETSLPILLNNNKCDGVYECTGVHAYDSTSEDLHKLRMSQITYIIPPKAPLFTTITAPLNPDKVFEALVIGGYGWFHFNAITLRKSSLNKTGLILAKLGRFGEDNEFFLRLAYHLQLCSGNISSPVAIRGVYSDNITLNSLNNKELMKLNLRGQKAMFKFKRYAVRKRCFHPLTYRQLFHSLIEHQIKLMGGFNNKFIRRALKLVLYPIYSMRFPLIFYRGFMKSMPPFDPTIPSIK
jgi:glycosyltransferase involved in cell wall biosynthesis